MLKETSKTTQQNIWILGPLNLLLLTRTLTFKEFESLLFFHSKFLTTWIKWILLPITKEATDRITHISKPERQTKLLQLYDCCGKQTHNGGKLHEFH